MRPYETFLFQESPADPDSAGLALVSIPVIEEYVAVEEKRTFMELLRGKKAAKPAVRQWLDPKVVAMAIRARKGGVGIATLFLESRPVSGGIARIVLHGFYADLPLGMTPDEADALPVRGFWDSHGGAVRFQGDMLIFCVEEVEYHDGRPYESRLKPIPLNCIQLERAFGIL